jgi:hypothetical protein
MGTKINSISGVIKIDLIVNESLINLKSGDIKVDVIEKESLFNSKYGKIQKVDVNGNKINFKSDEIEMDSKWERN